MIKIPHNCTGCSACIQICPKNCIKPSVDSEGFMIPRIEATKCIECNLCERVCPAININPSSNPSEFLVGQNESSETIYKSSSGGIFAMICEIVLKKGGIIYGAALDHSQNLSVKHIRINNIKDLHHILGSKYTQSNTGDSFKYAKKDLSEGKMVLFSGTPCQIAGLKKFLRKEYNSLITIDIICHGVPSPDIFLKYVKETEANESINLGEALKITDFSFRDKKHGWNAFGVSLRLQSVKNPDITKTIFRNRYDDLFMKGFLNDLFLRKSCHDCPVKNFSSSSDITLADAWRIETVMYSPSFDKGYSLVIPHTKGGLNILKSLNIKWHNVNRNFILHHNPAAYQSVRPHRKRQQFFYMISQGKSVSDAISKCLPTPTLFSKIKWSINQRLKHYVKK